MGYRNYTAKQAMIDLDEAVAMTLPWGDEPLPPHIGSLRHAVESEFMNAAELHPWSREAWDFYNYDSNYRSIELKTGESYILLRLDGGEGEGILRQMARDAGAALKTYLSGRDGDESGPD